MSIERQRPITIAMLALGGQGGGVLTNWLVALAETNGYLAQSTFVAGVAQRTGATVYCVEMFPQDAANAMGQLPVFTSYPIPGDVDLVVASEMAETGRAIEKGFVTPNISTLISSSHRVYSMPEKEALGDGIIDLSSLAEVAAKAARDFICFDMEAAATATDSIISSVIFGAIAASGALPFEKEAFEKTIQRSGKAVEANMRGFAAGFEGATAPSVASVPEEIGMPAPQGPNGAALLKRVETELPAPVRSVALHGALRALDYQDAKYANEYLDLLGEVVEIDVAHRDYVLGAEVARQLALQMCYEDIIRVADLKTRRDRFGRIRKQVAAENAQPVNVIEYFHPRIEELCDTLPASIGSFVLNSASLRKILAPFVSRGRNIRTTSISGFLLLHTMAKLRRFRRGTYRFGKQRMLIRDWLTRIIELAVKDYDAAATVAGAIEVVRGYGETYERGLKNYQVLLSEAGE